MRALAILVFFISCQKIGYADPGAVETLVVKAQVKWKEPKDTLSAVQAELIISKSIRIIGAKAEINGRIRMTADRSTTVFLKKALLIDNVLVDERFNLVDPRISGLYQKWPFIPDEFLKFEVDIVQSPSAHAKISLSSDDILIKNFKEIFHAVRLDVKEVTGIATCVLELFSIKDQQWGTVTFSFPVTVIF